MNMDARPSARLAPWRACQWADDTLADAAEINTHRASRQEWTRTFVRSPGPAIWASHRPDHLPLPEDYDLELLDRDGQIPVQDIAGHRDALQLWRDHCLRAVTSPPSAMLPAVQQVLAASRCDPDRGSRAAGR